MTNNIDQNRSIATGALAGGVLGAGVGSCIAPNVLGKVDINKALTHTPYTDVVRDKIAKLGEASRDLFKKQRDKYFKEEEAINNKYVEFLPGEQVERQTLIGDKYYAIENRKKSVTGKELKELVQGKKAKKFTDEGERIAKKFKEAIEKLDDEKVLNGDAIKKLMKENSDVCKTAKKTIQEFIDVLPKQKGKYAAIYATIGALASGALACIFGPDVKK